MLFQPNSRFSLLEKKIRCVIFVMTIYFSECAEVPLENDRTAGESGGNLKLLNQDLTSKDVKVPRNL